MYRQGDVLLISTEDEPTGRRRKRDRRDRIVLARGEATGHAHVVTDPGATLYGTSLQKRFLEVLADGGVTLSHEEHGAIRLAPGVYRVVRQREWVAEGSRWIAD
jgi:hypothetical protein